MPRNASATHTPKSLGKDPQPPSAEAAHAPSTQPPPFPPVHVYPSSSSLAGAEDGQDDVGTHITDNTPNQELSGTYNTTGIAAGGVGSTPSHCHSSFPTQPLGDGVDAGSSALPVITQPRHRRSNLSTPPSAAAGSFSTTSLNEVRGSPQKPPLQPSPQQHRLSKSSLASTPPRSIETAQLARYYPSTANPTGTTINAGAAVCERRAQKSGGHRRSSPSRSRTATPTNNPHPSAGGNLNNNNNNGNHHTTSTPARSSPAKTVSTPPPVHFSASHGTSTPTGQRSSPCPQALTSPAPQLALQRPASRSRPYIGSPPTTPPPSDSLAHPTESRSSPAGGGLGPSNGTPQRTPAAASGCSPSGRHTPIPCPSLHSRVSSEDSIHVPEPVPFSPLTGEDERTDTPATEANPTVSGGAANAKANAVVVPVTGHTPEVTAEEDQKDLLVEKIIQAPRKMGQSAGSCEKTHPPREASNSHSLPEDQQQQHQHHLSNRTPTRTDSPVAGGNKDGRSGGSRQGRRRTPSGSPNEKALHDKPQTRGSPAPNSPIPPSQLTNTSIHYSNNADIDDAQWVFSRPPNNQRTFYFKEDNLEFSSQFDSGNLIQVERLGPFQYRMYTAMDCGNSPWQTNNRQWFHFSLRGASKGTTVTFTFVGMMHSNMFNFDWMPVTALVPSRPEYTRLPGKAKVEPLENMPETPGYPLLVHKTVSKDDADSDGDNNEDDNDAEGNNANNNTNNNNNTSSGGVAFSIAVTNGKSGGAGKKGKKNKKKKYLAMNLTFEYKIEADVPVTHTPPKGRPDVNSIYIASNHPYSYTRLQRNLLAWQEVARKSNATRSQSVQAASKPPSMTARASQQQQQQESHSPPQVLSPGNESSETPRGAQTPSNTHLGDKSGDGGIGSTSTLEVPFNGIYYHREVLCKTHEGHDVTLLTISDRSRMTMERAPLISEKDGIPHSSAHRTTERPFAFAGKRYVVLTARVHPGECPGSHLMHGCIEFLMHRTDPRAAALRHNFVFYIIPMLNPDGVVRGHSRVDASGVDLNRMYRAPSRKRHPAPYAVMSLLKTLGDRVALFVDMHAHANKRGTFFYGNSMDGVEQVENLLYAKLVSINTPYLDFRSCNFSEANMFAVGKSGKGKDSSSRVVVYTDAGIVHGYTIEASHVMADSINPIVTLVSAQGEELEKTLPAPLQLAHTPATFGDTGRAMLVALLDLKNINPLSRLAYTPYHSTRGVSMWLQRQLQIETAEMLFAQAFKAHGKEVQAATHESGNNLLGPVLRSLTADEFPEKVTIKKARLLPRTTYSGVRYFLPTETAVALLSQTAPTGPPRSLLYVSGGANANGGGAGHGRRRGGSPATGSNSSPVTAAVAAGVSPTVPELPAVIATKRRTRPNASGTDTAVES